jgi:hypothetical protein
VTCGICGHVFSTGGIVTIRDAYGRRQRVMVCANCAAFVRGRQPA